MNAQRKQWVQHYRALGSLGRRWRIPHRQSLLSGSNARFSDAISARAKVASAVSRLPRLALIWLRPPWPHSLKERMDKTEVRHYWLSINWNLIWSWPLRQGSVDGSKTSSFANWRPGLSFFIRGTTKQLSERLYYPLAGAAGRLSQVPAVQKPDTWPSADRLLQSAIFARHRAFRAFVADGTIQSAGTMAISGIIGTDTSGQLKK